MDRLFHGFLQQTDWLYTKVYENNFFFIDYWTFPHLWSGLVVFYLLAAAGKKHKVFWLIFLITLYEIGEILLEIIALNIFKPETLKDKLSDVVVGISGGLIAYAILKWGSRNERSEPSTKNEGINFSSLARENSDVRTRNTAIIFSSLTLAFLWAGNFHYNCNITWMNLPGLNLWACAIWLAAGCVFLGAYLFVKKNFSRMYLQLILVLLIYFVLLIMIELLGYYIFRGAGIHDKNRLASGLMHTRLSLYIYYAVFPLLIILLYDLTLGKIRKARLRMTEHFKTG